MIVWERVNVDASIRTAKQVSDRRDFVLFLFSKSWRQQRRQLKRIRIMMIFLGLPVYVVLLLDNKEKEVGKRANLSRWFNIGMNWTSCWTMFCWLNDARVDWLKYTQTHLNDRKEKSLLGNCPVDSPNEMARRKGQKNKKNNPKSNGLPPYVSLFISFSLLAGHHREIKTWNSDIPTRLLTLSHVLTAACDRINKHSFRPAYIPASIVTLVSGREGAL